MLVLQFIGLGASLPISVRALSSLREQLQELTYTPLQRGGSSKAHEDDDESDYESEEEGDGDELKALKAEGDEPCKLVCGSSVVWSSRRRLTDFLLPGSCCQERPQHDTGQGCRSMRVRRFLIVIFIPYAD